MIRPFHLRDLTLVHRLAERGMVLQTQTALTGVPRPTRRALLHMLVGGRYLTYIWKSDRGKASAFAQMCWREGDVSAYIMNIGLESSKPSADSDEIEYATEWLGLLDEFVKEAGRLGIHNLVAEAPEGSNELEILRRAGFAIYTRQDVWVFDRVVLDKGDITLSPKQKIDEWDINILYSNSVPGLIHSVEPTPPSHSGQNWILRENNGELVAYLHVHSGSAASWMQLFIHPNAQTKPKEIVRTALGLIEPSPNHPVYCCVRRYQSWLQNALETTGFQPWGSQAVLVKQIVQPIKESKRLLTEMIPSGTVPGSPPAIQGFSQGDGKKYLS